MEEKRKSRVSKTSARKSMKGQSRKSMKRQSRKPSQRQSGQKSRKSTKFQSMAKKPGPLSVIEDYLKNPANMQVYYGFFKELIAKKEELIKDCKNGRKRFIDWLAIFLKGEGLVVETRQIPSEPLETYGPEGPPKAVLAYPLNPNSEHWTLCIFGRYEQVEERIKDPALLFNGKICYGRRRPETWGTLACWLATLKVLSVTRQPLPINIKICLTALQTDDAPAMIKFIKSIEDEFLKSVDFFAYATTLSVTTLPGGVAYSGRGVCHFVMEISNGNSEQEVSSSLTGYFRQPTHDMVKLMNDIEKDCVYTYLHMFEDFNLPHRFHKLVRRVYVRDLRPIKGFFNKKKVLEIKEKQAVEMWQPTVRLHDICCFSQHPLKIPTRLTVRFAVKYMTEASPIQVEEMVNRMLRKKWATFESDLTCKLSMNYWARPWYAFHKNRMYKPIKKAAQRAFHKCPTEALDFAPNSLPAVLQRLIPRDFCMIILASMPDMNHHRFRKNLKRNMKMLISFFYELGKSKTEKMYSRVWNGWRLKTRPYRIRHKNMEKRWHPPDESDEPPKPVLPPEMLEGKIKGTKPTKKSVVPRRASRKSKVSRKSNASRKSKVARKSQISNKRKSKMK